MLCNVHFTRLNQIKSNQIKSKIKDIKIAIMSISYIFQIYDTILHFYRYNNFSQVLFQIPPVFFISCCVVVVVFVLVYVVVVVVVFVVIVNFVVVLIL